MTNIYNEIVKFGNGFGSILDAIPNPDTVLRKSGSTYSGYRDLLYDAHLWSCVQSRKSGTLSTQYEVSGTNGGFISEALGKIDIQQLAEDILESLLYGFQPIEIYWRKDGDYILPYKAVSKPQELFYIDADGELRYRPNGQTKGVKLPDMKFLDIRNKPSHSAPYGTALLSKCYWPIKFKNGGIRFWVNFMERYGMPLLIGKYSRGASKAESERLAEELANMTEDSVIVTPNDIEISMEEPHRYSSVRLYSEMIRLSNSEVSKAILSQTLTTEVSSGSKAAAETHYKIRNEIVRSDMRLVESGINTLIGYIIKLNFGQVDDTQFRYITEQENLDTKLERDLKIQRFGGITFNSDYWIKQYGYSKEDVVG